MTITVNEKVYVSLKEAEDLIVHNPKERFALFSGPVAYFIFKRKYGGLAKTDAVRYPVNPKTRLGIGDTKRMAWMFGCLTAAGVIAIFFLPWYDDPQSYADDYGIEGFFETLMSGIRWMTAAFGALTATMLMIARRVEPSARRARDTLDPISKS